jgi:hypothetical protein
MADIKKRRAEETASAGCIVREEIVGWNQDTLVRLLWDGDVLDIEVVPNEPTAGWRNRVGNSRMALLGRPGGEGFDLRLEADYHRLRNALEALVPPEGSGSTDALIPAGAHSHWFVPTGCSEGCVLHIRAYSPDEDDAGWISIDLISNAKTRRDGSIRGRLANALGASLGHVGWATWCPLLTPAALRAALASASSVAFPHLEDASSVPRRGIAKDKDNGKDGNG